MSNFIRIGTVAMPIFPPNPPASKFYIGFNSSNLNHLTLQDSSGTLTDLQSGLEYTDEKAQDAIAAAFTDTVSANFTYNDVANTMQIDVLPAGVDHDQLLNFVANEHINHSSVNINAGTGLTGGGDITASRTLSVDEPNVNHDNLQNFVANEHVDHTAVTITAGVGLSGGGDISANRTIDLAVDELTALAYQTRVPTDSYIPYYDTTLAAHRRANKNQLLTRNTDRVYIEDNDFIIATAGGLTASVTGTGASNQAGTYGINASENALGVSQLDTGTTAAGRAGLGTVSVNQIFVQTTDYFRLCYRVAIEALSVNGVEAFTQYIGFSSNTATTGGLGNQFIGFRYTDSVNGGRWEFVVQTGAVLSAAVDTGILADVNYHVFNIEVDGATGTAYGYIDGTLVATVNTGVPSGSAESFGFRASIEKSVGITQRNMSIDWYCYEYFRTSAR
jgi:hypothetical protein